MLHWNSFFFCPFRGFWLFFSNHVYFKGHLVVFFFLNASLHFISWPLIFSTVWFLIYEQFFALVWKTPWNSLKKCFFLFMYRAYGELYIIYPGCCWIHFTLYPKLTFSGFPPSLCLSFFPCNHLLYLVLHHQPTLFFWGRGQGKWVGIFHRDSKKVLLLNTIIPESRLLEAMLNCRFWAIV